MHISGKGAAEARQKILRLVGEYCDTYHRGVDEEGGKIPYAARVYDRAEMVNLVDSALEFWLTGG
ncbi:MAG: lipopolysaccharide biosynthesis protein RfbH, partial [Clostridia bacterium]|nr:lipopolysaccharide biosynthesis protein RfbH [Clostridia bacterium]